MYRKIAITLIVVGLLVTGYGVFTGSTAQAALPCDSTSLAANPELLKVTCSEVTTDESNVQRAFEANAARYKAMAAYYLSQNETSVQRANDANAARYAGLAEFYAGEKGTSSSTFFASNPELLAHSRYAAEIEWHRIHFPGR